MIKNGKGIMASILSILVVSAIFSVIVVNDRSNAKVKAEKISSISEDKSTKTKVADEYVKSNNNVPVFPTEKDKIEKLKNLELHINDRTVYTADEVDALIDKGIAEYERYGRAVISNLKYADDIRNGIIDMNSIESKSYIYHQMLNSVDYFNSAEGTMTYALNISSPIDIFFQTDIEKGISYEKESQFGTPINEYYVADKEKRTVDLRTNEYTETYCAEPAEFAISDNDRVVMLDNSQLMNLNRNDITNLGTAGNSCLFPQTYAASYLFDFEKWSITDTVEALGRNSVIIEGVHNSSAFTMTVDLYTGIMLNYKEFDENGAVSGYIEVNEIEIDNDVSVNQIDKNTALK